MTLRIGLLAASRIAGTAVIDPLRDPAQEIVGVEVSAVAARDLDRARAAAEQWSIPLAFGSYDELLACADVDAVYVGTPAALHRPWAIAAIEAGKHVLCEKPLAANADDARRLADAARGADVVVMEAFHWRYHPYADQIGDVIDSGVLGRIDRIETVFDIAEGRIGRDDIRWDLALGGGATMDLGCYSIQWARFASRMRPEVLPEVVSAEAVCPIPDIDGSLVAELRWPSGVTGSVGSSMIAAPGTDAIQLSVTGERGTLLATNPLAPQRGARLTVDTDDGTVEHPVETTTTYGHQLEAFRDAVLTGAAFPTTADDGVRNMELIDACYRAAGLEPRPSAPD